VRVRGRLHFDVGAGFQAAVAEKDYQRRYGRMDGSKSMRTNYVAPLDVQEGKKVFALVVQLLITMAACFAFGWYAVGSILVDEPAMVRCRTCRTCPPTHYPFECYTRACFAAWCVCPFVR
jgi:hypothetical protein